MNVFLMTNLTLVHFPQTADMIYGTDMSFWALGLLEAVLTDMAVFGSGTA